MTVKNDFYEEVIASLGGTLVDVELTPTELDICYKKARRQFIQKGHNSYKRAFYPLSVQTGVVEYQLPESVDTVVKIIKQSYGFNVEDPFSLASFNDVFSAGWVDSGDFLSYEMTLHRIEKWQRYMAYEEQFKLNAFTKKLQLYRRPKKDETWLVEVYHNLEDSEYQQIDWIIRWTIAEAKEMLGIAYRKFGSVAGPTGEVSLNGADYIADARAEKEALLLEIENYVDGDSDFSEIRFG